MENPKDKLYEEDEFVIIRPYQDRIDFFDRKKYEVIEATKDGKKIIILRKKNEVNK